MYVVLDTNIWLHELALQTPLGSAVRFFLRQGGHKLVVPEVIRLEVEKNLRSDLRDWRDSIAESHRKLLAMFGKLPEVKLPTDADIEQRVTSVFDGSGLDIVAVPFSLDSARAALLKTIDGVAPSGPKNQQFKDGVIWADCMQLLDRDDVTLVTEDRAFYHDRAKPDLGPAENLAAEAKARPRSLVLLPDLGRLLGNIREKVQIDEGAVADAMAAASAESIDAFLARQGYVLGERRVIKLKLFATEEPARLAGSATVTYACAAIDQQLDGSPGTLTQVAEFEYDCTKSAIVSIRQGSETMETVGPEGEPRFTRIVYAVGGGTLGHRTVRHEVRRPLQGDG